MDSYYNTAHKQVILYVVVVVVVVVVVSYCRFTTYKQPVWISEPATAGHSIIYQRNNY